MERIFGFLEHYIKTLIRNIKNLFSEEGSRVYTGAIPEN